MEKSHETHDNRCVAICVVPRTNNFIIDCYLRSGDLNDLKVKIYVDNVRMYDTTDYTIFRQNGYAYIKFNTDLQLNQKVVIESTSATAKNHRGYYKFPINFEKNPMNENVVDFTFGEVLDHVSSIVDNVNDFTGSFPGVGNLRDLVRIPIWIAFVQHSDPINPALFNLTSKDYNMIKAIEYSREYIQQKREFQE